MIFEVELKFPLRDCDAADLEQRLRAMGAVAGPVLHQRDIYFAHPARDFAATDEALRLRTTDDSSCLTYKGPKIDRRTKTRREIEVALAPGTQPFAQCRELLQALGFRPVRNVIKTRHCFQLPWQGRNVQVALDEVEELGAFVELELLADEAERDATRDSLLQLAQTLSLSEPEMRSYLCLLLEQDQRTDRPALPGKTP